MNSRDTNEELGWLVCGGFAVVIVAALWRRDIRPWLVAQDLPLVEVRKAGAGFNVDQADLIPLVLVAVALVGVYFLLRPLRRARGRGDARGDDQDGASKKRKS